MLYLYTRRIFYIIVCLLFIPVHNYSYATVITLDVNNTIENKKDNFVTFGTTNAQISHIMSQKANLVEPENKLFQTTKAGCSESYEIEEQFHENMGELATFDELPPVEEAPNLLTTLDAEIEDFSLAAENFMTEFNVLLGVGMGALALTEGITHHNTDQIVMGSIGIGTSIGMPLLSRVIAGIFSAATAEVIGGGVGAALAEGMAIYSGIKDDKILQQVAEQNDQLNDTYKANVARILLSIQDIKGIVLGNQDNLFHYDIKNASELLFFVNKERIQAAAEKIISLALIKKAEILSQSYIDTTLAHFPSSGYVTIPELTISVDKNEIINNLNTMNTYFHDNYQVFQTDVQNWGTYEVSRRYFFTAGPYHSTISDLTNVPTFAYFYRPLLLWFKDVLNPTVKTILRNSFEFSDADLLGEEMLGIIQAEFENPHELQAQMLLNYQNVIRKKVSWLIFGEKLLDAIPDYHAHNAGVWVFRVLSPMIEQLVDSKLIEAELKTLQLAPTINRMVELFANADVSIFDEDAVRELIHDKFDQFEEAVPKDYINYINDALGQTKHIINSTFLIQPSDIKPFEVTDQQMDSVIYSLNEIGKTGYFATELYKGINDYISQLFYLYELDDPHQRELADNLVAMAVGNSKLHEAYSQRVQFHISQAVEAINSNIQDYQLIHTLEDLIQSVHFEYMSFVNADPGIYQNSDKGDAYIPWFSFQTLPGVKQETAQVIDFLTDTITALQANSSS